MAPLATLDRPFIADAVATPRFSGESSSRSADPAALARLMTFQDDRGGGTGRRSGMPAGTPSPLRGSAFADDAKVEHGDQLRPARLGLAHRRHDLGGRRGVRAEADN